MNINMGSQTFLNVVIPILWGTRAILQNPEGKISVIDLSGIEAKLEILEDEPAKGIEFSLTNDGFTVKKNSENLYTFNSKEHSLKSGSLNLPDLAITQNEVKVGGGTFSNNMVSGSAVGIIVDETSLGIGASLPPNLAKLVI